MACHPKPTSLSKPNTGVGWCGERDLPTSFATSCCSLRRPPCAHFRSQSCSLLLPQVGARLLQVPLFSLQWRQIKKSLHNKMKGSFCVKPWCGERDLNPHGISPNSPSNCSVYQFRHLRTPNIQITSVLFIPRTLQFIK